MDLGASEDDDRIHFAGFLANVDSSILKLPLDWGFSIRQVSRQERDSLLTKLEQTPIRQPDYESAIGRLRWSDSSYLIENTFDAWATMAGENEEGVVLELEHNDVARVMLYLQPALSRLRFATCKNIFLPLQYYYVDSNDEIVLRRKVWTSGIVETRRDYPLSDIDLTDFETATKRGIPPFRQEFLQLALQHFELSFETEHRPLAFLTLMIALEVILQPGWGGKSDPLARNAAKLLASQAQDRNLIIRELKDLYHRRNTIIHEGTSFVRTEKGREALVDDEILFRARDYVKRLLIRAHELGKSKQSLSVFFQS